MIQITNKIAKEWSKGNLGFLIDEDTNDATTCQ
jgi:hypothetical protein